MQLSGGDEVREKCLAHQLDDLRRERFIHQRLLTRRCIVAPACSIFFVGVVVNGDALVRSFIARIFRCDWFECSDAGGGQRRREMMKNERLDAS